MTRKERLIILGGLATLLAMAVACFFLFFEKVSEDVDLEATGEARFNQFLAAERTLDELGLPTDSVNVLSVPASTDELLLILGPERVGSQTRADQLYDWVASGGHLVITTPWVVPSTFEEILKKLSEELGKSRTDKDKSEDNSEGDVPDGDPNAEAPPDDQDASSGTQDEDYTKDIVLSRFQVWPISVKAYGDARARSFGGDTGQNAGEHAIVNDAGPLINASGEALGVIAQIGLPVLDWQPEALDQVEVWGNRYTLSFDGNVRETGLLPVIMQARVGKGTLTVLPMADPWSNDGLGHADQARILWRLIQRPVEAGQTPPIHATLVFMTDSPSLWVLMWRAAWPAMISGGVLLIVWLWGASRRFGPLLPSPPAASRSLGEHVSAVGRYLWQNDGRKDLLDSATAAARRALLQGDRPDEAADALLASRAGLSPDDIALATRATATDASDFTRTLRAVVAVLAARPRRLG